MMYITYSIYIERYTMIYIMRATQPSLVFMYTGTTTAHAKVFAKGFANTSTQSFAKTFAAHRKHCRPEAACTRIVQARIDAKTRIYVAQALKALYMFYTLNINI